VERRDVAALPAPGLRQHDHARPAGRPARDGLHHDDADGVTERKAAVRPPGLPADRPHGVHGSAPLPPRAAPVLVTTATEHTMTGSTRDFYQQLAGDYHLIFADWEASVVRQGAVLDGLIRAFLPGPSLDLLDCSCGIGTQAL